jgi:hypothetical protein
VTRFVYCPSSTSAELTIWGDLLRQTGDLICKQVYQNKESMHV